MIVIMIMKKRMIEKEKEEHKKKRNRDWFDIVLRMPQIVLSHMQSAAYPIPNMYDYLQLEIQI